MMIAVSVTPNTSLLCLMGEKDLTCDASHSIIQDTQQQGSNHCKKRDVEKCMVTRPGRRAASWLLQPAALATKKLFQSE